MYMDGQGVQKRSDDLAKALKAEQASAINGAAAGIVSPVIVLVILFLTNPDLQQQAMLIAFLLVSELLAFCFVIPYWRIRVLLLAHIKAMKEQTEISGKGWAKD